MLYRIQIIFEITKNIFTMTSKPLCEMRFGSLGRTRTADPMINSQIYYIFCDKSQQTTTNKPSKFNTSAFLPYRHLLPFITVFYY